MKTKIVLISVLLSAGLVASASAAGRGNRSGTPNTNRGNASGVCDLSGPGQGNPLRDGSGRARADRGNPAGNGTPRQDGSGKATAPGKGPKDGTGNRADCPIVPKT